MEGEILDASPQKIRTITTQNYFQRLSPRAQKLPRPNLNTASLQSRHMKSKTFSPEWSVSESTTAQTNPQKKITNKCGDGREGRQTGSLFSPLFLDKYLISGTLMGIDWSPYPLFIDPSSL